MICELCLADAEKDEKDLDHNFLKGWLSVGAIMGSPANEDKRCLGVFEIKLYGTQIDAIMNAVSVPNWVSVKAVKRLGANLERSILLLTVANGSMAGVLSKLNYVPVDHGGAAFNMHLVLLENLPFDVFIGSPTISRLQKVLVFEKSDVHFVLR